MLAQSRFAVSGLLGTTSLVFRAKRRSAGSKNSAITVIGQPKCGVLARCRDCEAEF